MSTSCVRLKSAAPPSQFDDVIISNNENLRREIFIWSEELRDAEKLEKNKPGSIKEVLDDYKNILATKKFTWEGNDKLVMRNKFVFFDVFGLNSSQRDVCLRRNLSTRTVQRNP